MRRTAWIVATAAAAGMLAAHAIPASAQPVGNAGVEERVNNPDLDTPEATTQSEPALAVLGSTVCAGYNNTRTGPIPNPLSGFSRSGDRGVTWMDRGFTGRFRFSDPVLAVHEASGTFYYADIAFLGTATIIGVAKSTDDCTTFPTLANASPSATAEQTQDKPWIAVDNSGGPFDGNVYACWTRFGDDNSLHFSRSTDAGATFTDEQVIAPPTDVSPFGCHVSVGPGGEVYVAWSDRGADFPIQFRRSPDGGLTWDAPVQVNTAPIRQPGTDRFLPCEPGIVRPTLNGDIRMLPQAWMAVDTTGGPFNGTIYVVWTSDPPGSVDNSDVFLSRSTDGVTWSPEVQLGGDSETDQFLPTLAVGGAGTLSVAWYDRRNDPANNFNIDVYSAISRDGGVTFEPIFRLTNESFPVPPLTGQPTVSGNFDPGRSACYMGDYIALTADADYFYYAWGDNRRTVGSSTYPNGRPDPDVIFERRLISCGDGTSDPLEACDDGNLVNGDGCDSNCTLTACGNGIVTTGEQCDDGNSVNGDGCDTDCMIAPTHTPTATASVTPSPTPTLTQVPTATSTPTVACAADCNANHAVTVDELVRAVNIALGSSTVSACPSADVNRDGRVTVDEIVQGVNAALDGCP